MPSWGGRVAMARRRRRRRIAKAFDVEESIFFLELESNNLSFPPTDVN